MNTTIDFTVLFENGRIISVLTPSGEDITFKFVQFCADYGLPVSSEAHVRVAIQKFKRTHP